MEQDTFNLSVTFTLLAALLYAGNIAHAETNTPQSDGITSGSVSRATFTTAVINREPEDQITELTNNVQRIYFFTELKDMTGQTIHHRWSYNDQTMAEVEFTVGAPRWRIWSSKTLLPHWLGEWTVTVVNEAGEEITSNNFNYIENLTEAEINQ